MPQWGKTQILSTQTSRISHYIEALHLFVHLPEDWLFCTQHLTSQLIMRKTQQPVWRALESTRVTRKKAVHVTSCLSGSGEHANACQYRKAQDVRFCDNRLCVWCTAITHPYMQLFLLQLFTCQVPYIVLTLIYNITTCFLGFVFFLLHFTGKIQRERKREREGRLRWKIVSCCEIDRKVKSTLTNVAVTPQKCHSMTSLAYVRSNKCC